MITEYFRPETIEGALALLSGERTALAMGGGAVLNAPHRAAYAVVDLQALGLDEIRARGRFVEVGAAATLQALADATWTPDSLRIAIEREATRNLRHQGTVAGALVAADGRSPLAAVMLALDAQVLLAPGGETLPYGQVLHLRTWLDDSLAAVPGRLITQVGFHSEAALAYEYVARSPADRPVVTAAAAAWPSGRLRVVVGGWGKQPRLALDAPEPGGVSAAVESAAAEAEDQWAGAEYRRAAAVELAERAVSQVAG